MIAETVTNRMISAMSFRSAKFRRTLGCLLLLMITSGATVEVAHSHGAVSPDSLDFTASSDAGITLGHKPFSSARMRHLPASAATFHWTRPGSTARARAFDATRVRLDAESSSSLKSNHPSIGTRPASLLRLTRSLSLNLTFSPTNDGTSKVKHGQKVSSLLLPSH